MSDDLASKSFMAHYSLEEIGRAALNSGVNILLVGGYPNALVVGDFYRALRGELAKEQTSLSNTAGAGALLEILSSMVEGDGRLQERVEQSADKIIKIKEEMLWKTFGLQ
jgi:beta-glucosidase-like glycosyl hydrolase